MKVCILAQNFPTYSETFVTDHAKSVLDASIDLSILANKAEPGAWSGLEDYEKDLKKLTFLYNRQDSKTSGYRFNRLKSLVEMSVRHQKNGSTEFFKSLNFFRFGSSTLDLKLPFIYSKAIEIEPVDILHCHFGSNGIIGAHLKSLGFCKKLVVTYHGLDVSKVILNKNKGHIYKNVFRQADLILPISNLWKEALVSAGASKEITKVHHLGVDVDNIPIRSPQSHTAEKFRIVTTARFTEKKGLPIALRAVSEAVKKSPGLNLQYDIIGSGNSFSEIQKLIEDLQLSQIVHLHGALPHSRVKELLYRSDIFMLPSHTAKNGDQEGIPVSLMEAMAAGLPVLSTRHSGIPELIEHEQSGLLVDEKNYMQLADAILRLSRNPELREQLALNGRKTIEQKFNANKQNSRLIEMYSQLLSS